MRKAFGLALVAMILALSVVAVEAASTGFYINVYQKNPSTWLPVKNGMFGQVFGWAPMSANPKVNNIQFIAMKVEPYTSYTLVYYGDATHNDVWPFATCIATATSGGPIYPNGKSGVSGQGRFNYVPFLSDSVGEKFWIVPTSDVNCVAGMFTVWNPASYLFEQSTI